MGVISVFSAQIASGASTSTGINLARGWPNIAVQVSTMSTATVVNLYNSTDSGSTYYQVMTPVVNTTTVGVNALSIATGVATGGGLVQLPVYGLSYIQFRTTAVVSGGVNFKIICSD
jgi:hypothetical protein